MLREPPSADTSPTEPPLKRALRRADSRGGISDRLAAAKDGPPERKAGGS
jgi:hypothetical protein